ncbi:MAG TPA: hypothetical protein VHD86_09370 [Xanthobacteraceae bacterium]|nr:hypothetical protein [Xanthobacteraceae bacterium]
MRLLLGALVASVVALTCGFGLFAAFRVNHEPLSRLPVGTAPAQFVANDVAAPRTGWGTPFDGQSHLNGPQRGEIAVDAPDATGAGQINVMASGTGTAEISKPAAAATPVIETSPPRALAQPAEVIEPAVSVTPAATVPPPPAPEAAEQILPSVQAANGSSQQVAPAAAPVAVAPADNAANPPSIAPDQTASVRSSSADTPTPSASAKAPPDLSPVQVTGTIASTSAAPEPSASVPAASAAPAVSDLSAQKPPVEAEAVTPVPAAKPDNDSGAAMKAAGAAPPANEAAPSPMAVTAPVKAAAKPVRKIEAKKTGKIVRKLAVHRRPAVRRRIVRRVRRSPGQNGSPIDPVFQSAPSFSSASASRSAANSSGW